jgi:hypothetical protein
MAHCRDHDSKVSTERKPHSGCADEEQLSIRPHRGNVGAGDERVVAVPRSDYKTLGKTLCQLQH